MLCSSASGVLAWGTREFRARSLPACAHEPQLIFGTFDITIPHDLAHLLALSLPLVAVALRRMPQRCPLSC